MSVSDFGAPRGLIRQGDVLLIPVDHLPEGTQPNGSGRLVLAEGEATGHAHVIDDPRASLAVKVALPDTLGDTTFLLVDGHAAVALTHEEHSTLLVPPGAYEVRRQREYAPRVQDRSRWVAD